MTHSMYTYKHAHMYIYIYLCMYSVGLKTMRLENVSPAVSNFILASLIAFTFASFFSPLVPQKSTHWLDKHQFMAGDSIRDTMHFPPVTVCTVFYLIYPPCLLALSLYFPKDDYPLKHQIPYGFVHHVRIFRFEYFTLESLASSLNRSKPTKTSWLSQIIKIKFQSYAVVPSPLSSVFSFLLKIIFKYDVAIYFL